MTSLIMVSLTITPPMYIMMVMKIVICVCSLLKKSTLVQTTVMKVK